MATSIRWFRWLLAWALLTATAIVTWLVGEGLVQSPNGDLTAEIVSDVGRWWHGDIDRRLVLRAGLTMMMVIIVRLAAWLILVMMEQLRRGSIHRPAPRLLAFVLTSGVAWGVAAGDVSAESRSCLTSWNTNEAMDCSSTQVVMIHESSNVDIAGTALVSGLLGAGLGLRLRTRAARLRRDSSTEQQIDVDTSHRSFEVSHEFLAAEQNYRQMIDVVRRVIEADSRNRIRHVVDEKNGWIVVEFTDPPKPIARSERVHAKALRMRVTDFVTTDEDLVDSRLPALLHVGRSVSGEVWISLDEYSSFGVDCSHDEGDRVWRHLCQSLILGPSFESRGVVSDRDLGSYPTRRCFIAGKATSIDEVAERVGTSIAVVHGGSPASSQPSIFRVADGQVEVGLKKVGDEWRLLPADVVIRPVGSNLDEVTSIKALLGDRIAPIVVDYPAVSEPETSWDFMACVLGPPRVVDPNFLPVRFERGKAEELVIWLAFHPEQRRRSLARSALWLSPIQDATFSNITAAARRSLNAVRTPPDGGNWVGITMSDELPLAEGVITDVQVLREAVSDARLRPEEFGAEGLRRALELVRGVPFAGSTYTWSDGIGVCGEAATLVVRASMMMAEMCEEKGDIPGVYWATAKGLLALPGHEELVAVRLRAHARRGDRVAMRTEWESFRRAVSSEWGDAEPSAKILGLWRSLTSDWSTQESHQTGENPD